MYQGTATQATYSDKEFGNALAELKPFIRNLLKKQFEEHSQLEDVVQNTIHKAWKSRHQYEGRAKLSTWVMRIAVNTHLDFIRDSNKKPVLCYGGVPDPVDPHDYLSFEEDTGGILDKLGEQIREHKPEYSDVFRYRRQGLTYQEIADELGLKRTQVRGQVRRMLVWCRKETLLERFKYTL